MIVEELEYGPGFASLISKKEEDADDIELLKGFKRYFPIWTTPAKSLLRWGVISPLTVFYLTKVIDTKVTHDAHYCIIDGGINHINYYGQAAAMKLPHDIQYYPVSAEAIPGQPGAQPKTNRRIKIPCHMEYLRLFMQIQWWRISEAISTITACHWGLSVVWERPGSLFVTEGILPVLK